jgi:thiamine pyrophosphokinase
VDKTDTRFVMLVSGSPVGATSELLWQLAEGMSFIVAVDSGAEWCSAAGLIPDLLVGDMDSISPAVRAAFAEQEVEEIALSPEKDASDFELALEEVLRRGYTDLVATNVLGGRLDHELAALGNLATCGEQGLAITVVEPTQTLVFMNNPGVRQMLRLNYGDDISPEDSPLVSLIPWGGPATVSLTGFQWELDHAVLSPAKSLGVSNKLVSESSLVELHQGSLIIVVQAPGHK